MKGSHIRVCESFSLEILQAWALKGLIVYAQACKISRLNDAQPANSRLSGPIRSVFKFSAVSFDGDPFICQCKKEDKKA